MSEKEIDEHIITIRSVQEYKGGFDASSLQADGNLSDNVNDLEFQREMSLGFTCSCGRRFTKWETAAEHLREKVPREQWNLNRGDIYLDTR